MTQKYRTACRAIFSLLLLCATPALANHVDSANATFTCNSYSLSLRASELVPGHKYQINYTIDRNPSSGGSPIIGSIPFTARTSSYETAIWGSFPTLNGTFSFSGSASLAGWNTIRHRCVADQPGLRSNSAAGVRGDVRQCIELQRNLPRLGPMDLVQCELHSDGYT